MPQMPAQDLLSGPNRIREHLGRVSNGKTLYLLSDMWKLILDGTDDCGDKK